MGPNLFSLRIRGHIQTLAFGWGGRVDTVIEGGQVVGVKLSPSQHSHYLGPVGRPGCYISLPNGLGRYRQAFGVWVLKSGGVTDQATLDKLGSLVL